MEKGSFNGRTIDNMKGNIWMIRKMGQEHLRGLMEGTIMGNGN